MAGTRLSIAVVAVLVLAGCAGLGGGPATIDPAEAAYPDGFGMDGITNASTAVQGHAATLDSPYRVEFRLVQSGARGTVTTRGTIRARPGDEQALTRLNQSSGSSAQELRIYQADGGVYVYRGTEQTYAYESEEGAFQRPVYADRRTFVGMLDALSLEATTIRTVDGTQVIEYSVTDVESRRIGANTTDASGTVTVAETGQIRSMDLSFTQSLSGVERETSFEYTVTPGANVTVERPDWIDMATTNSSG